MEEDGTGSQIAPPDSFTQLEDEVSGVHPALVV